MCVTKDTRRRPFMQNLTLYNRARSLYVLFVELSTLSRGFVAMFHQNEKGRSSQRKGQVQQDCRGSVLLHSCVVYPTSIGTTIFEFKWKHDQELVGVICNYCRQARLGNNWVFSLKSSPLFVERPYLITFTVICICRVLQRRWSSVLNKDATSWSWQQSNNNP